MSESFNCNIALDVRFGNFLLWCHGDPRKVWMVEYLLDFSEVRMISLKLNATLVHFIEWLEHLRMTDQLGVPATGLTCDPRACHTHIPVFFFFLLSLISPYHLRLTPIGLGYQKGRDKES